MTARSRTSLTVNFEDGDVPSGQNFTDMIDSAANLIDTTTQDFHSTITAPVGQFSIVSAGSIYSDTIICSALNISSLTVTAFNCANISTTTLSAVSVVVNTVSANLVVSNSYVGTLVQVTNVTASNNIVAGNVVQGQNVLATSAMQAPIIISQTLLQASACQFNIVSANTIVAGTIQGQTAVCATNLYITTSINFDKVATTVRASAGTANLVPTTAHGFLQVMVSGVVMCIPYFRNG